MAVIYWRLADENGGQDHQQPKKLMGQLLMTTCRLACQSSPKPEPGMYWADDGALLSMTMLLRRASLQRVLAGDVGPGGTAPVGILLHPRRRVTGAYACILKTEMIQTRA